MGSQGPTQNVTRDDIRRFLSQTPCPSTPFFTEEISEALECPPQVVKCCLEELVDRGEIRTKQGNGSDRVWWKPQRQLSSSRQPGEEQFRAFVSAVTDYAIFLLGPDGNIVSWNEGADRIKGYSEDEILGKHFSTFYTDEDIADDVPEQNLEDVVADGRIEDEGWRVRADGSRFWANVTLTAIRDDEGELRGFTKVTRDMTDRREYEQQLEEQAEKLERQRDELEAERDEIFKRVDEAFMALDNEWNITYVNDQTADLVQLPPEELLGARVWDVLYEIADEHPREMAEEAMAANEPLELEYFSNVLDIWVEVRGYPIESGMSVYFRDITGRKERERELQHVRERMEFALNATDAVVWDWNVDEDRASFYPSAESLYGTTVETWEDFVEVIHPEDRQTVREGIEKALETGEPKSEEIRIVRDGEVRWIEAPGYPIQDDDGPTRVIGVARDITEQKTYERKLEESNERLEQFAYAASHDLQEPLRMVSSYLQLIEHRYVDDLDEDGREFIEFAVDGAERMRAMIDGLLEYSRVETEGEPFEPVDLNDVLENVMADLQIPIEEHDAEITVEELPTVEGDASQLRQLFQNLLKNAIEYSGDEPPHANVSATGSGDEWTLSVTDEGIGIDPENQERIFEVFERLHTQEEHAGTGIGLALCKRIVERHGGEIWVDSTPSGGARFSLTLQNPQ
ncbi:PAS domain-containing sensor histidine kinase [Natrinema salsiterrestre]|uniref:histidine kinase n=1 Tax=Natrinema salsiterrestre TaxID=2950540 RepID=A0A9Q4L5B1_9EURY|nr:PAS domain S-box protein [Natrinema salsiterrestre]MDF9747907.1 PAS domain S-box protein [Natrinema salsiterrestre]